MADVAGNDTISLLDDGQLKFLVRLPDGTEETKSVDILTLKLFCEAKEAEHSLQAIDGRLVATEAFMADMAASLEARFGLVGLTPSLTWKVWIAAADAMARLKN